MKTYTLFKDWYLMDANEQNEFRRDLLDCYLENYQDERDCMNKSDFEDYCIEVNNSDLYDNFGRDGNVIYSPLANQKVIVLADLGLWDGRRKASKEFENLSNAIFACLEDMNHIYEDQYGNLHIDAHHHDGVNHFIIKKLVNGKQRCLHYRREVFGY